MGGSLRHQTTMSRGLESWDCSACGREGLEGSLIHKYLMGEDKEDEMKLSGSLGKDKNPWAQTEGQENPRECKETHFHGQSGQTPEQFAQGSHEFCILGDTQNSPSLSFGQLAQGGPAWAGGWTG